MKTPRIPFFLATAAILAASGCAMPTPGESPGEGESIGAAQQALGDMPPGGKNGKRGRCTWDPLTRAAYVAYATHPLNLPSTGALPSMTLSTDCRNEVIANMVECALPQTMAVYDAQTNTYFRGWWGLAPEWYSAPLTSVSARRYVTGCMIQRLNAYEAVVPILLEGASPVINKDPALEVDYPFEESIAFGDLFSSITTNVHVCYYEDIEGLCRKNGLTPSKWLELRICDSSVDCGLDVVGLCSDHCIVKEGYSTCDSVDETVEVRLPLEYACGSNMR